ncbi:MAG: HAD hydrolase-like protein [Pseudomonadota bacterium]|nr:HAD hydrolase-like protein [Sphingomonas sp.]MDQ3471192.1 HAD hydrolase-like protein [Pseudomonadota bacterium]
MNKLAIFDCDGTLVDSGATIYQALAEAFAMHGVQLPPVRDCRRVIGLSLTEAMAALLPDGDPREHVELAETYKGCFVRARTEGRVQEPLFDGILDLLDTLEADGWLLAVATGKSDRGLGHCLNSHGIHARFVSLQTGDRHASKPDPGMALAAIAESGAAPETTIVIGDTAFDMGMAQSAGAAGIGAAWGYHEPHELIAAGAFAVAHAPAEVERLAAAAMERVDG